MKNKVLIAILLGLSIGFYSCEIQEGYEPRENLRNAYQENLFMANIAVYVQAMEGAIQKHEGKYSGEEFQYVDNSKSLFAPGAKWQVEVSHGVLMSSGRYVFDYNGFHICKHATKDSTWVIETTTERSFSSEEDSFTLNLEARLLSKNERGSCLHSWEVTVSGVSSSQKEGVRYTCSFNCDKMKYFWVKGSPDSSQSLKLCTKGKTICEFYKNGEFLLKEELYYK